MIGIRVNPSPPDHLAHYHATDGSELRVVCGQFLHRSAETGGAWVPVPMFALADVFTAACDCPPCPGRGRDGHGMEHCAECCFGQRVIADEFCPVHGRADEHTATDAGYDTAAEAVWANTAIASALVGRAL